MDQATRAFIKTQLLTLTELADLLGKTVTATRKYAERKGFDYVLKGGVRFYFRGDFVAPLPDAAPAAEPV